MIMKKFFYRVDKEDGVVSVAKKFGVSVTRLIEENSLTGEAEEGDVLFVDRGGGIVYSVRPEDTLKSVAQKFGVPPESIAALNGTDYLFYGLTINVPEKP